MPKQLHIYDVIIRPIVTEKTNDNKDDFNQFTFEVAQSATKIQIKEAIEVIFDVDVTNINTMVMPAKRGRRGRKFYVRKQSWKKAVVTLATGQKIDLEA